MTKPDFSVRVIVTRNLGNLTSPGSLIRLIEVICRYTPEVSGGAEVGIQFATKTRGEASSQNKACELEGFNMSSLLE